MGQFFRRYRWVLIGVGGAIGIATFVLVLVMTTTPAYVAMQNELKQELPKRTGTPVTSVACTPHTRTVSAPKRYDFECTVVEQGGRTYEIGATLRTHTKGGGNSYSWDTPPAK